MRTTACNANAENPLAHGLPFPLPGGEAAAVWLDQLDAVDLLHGDLDRLQALAAQAPSSEVRSFLDGVIFIREHARIFGGFVQ